MSNSNNSYVVGMKDSRSSRNNDVGSSSLEAAEEEASLDYYYPNGSRSEDPPSSPPLTSSRLTFECVHASSLSTEKESIHRVMENLKVLVSYSLMFRNRKFLERAIAIVLNQKREESNVLNMNFAMALKRQLNSLPRPACLDCNLMAGDLMACLHCPFCGCHEENHGRNHFLSYNHLFG